MMKPTYPITVTVVDNGYIVTAGCVSLVFTKEKLLMEFARWVENPQQVEAEYGKKYRDIEAGYGLQAQGGMLGGPGRAIPTNEVTDKDIIPHRR